MSQNFAPSVDDILSCFRSEIAYGAFVLCLNKAYPPYIALTKISTISRGGVKINVSRYMIQLDF